MGLIRNKMIEMNEKAKKFPKTEDLEILKTQIQKEEINDKLILIGGPAGTGILAAAESKYSPAHVCPYGHQLIEPQYLLEDLEFEDGKAVLKATPLVNAMIKGEFVIIDECDTINDKILDFIETITTTDELDPKSFNVSVPEEKIKINPSFKVIILFRTPSWYI